MGKMILGKTKRGFGHILYMVPGVLVGMTLFLGILLAGMRTYADVVDDIYILVSSSCTLTGTVDTAHTTTLMPGNSAEGFGQTTFKVICNDSSGYGIYAIGFTDDVDGRTYMGHTTDSSYQIQTGTSGSDSYWAMKLAKVTDTSVSYEPSNLSIISPFTNYTAVPSSWTKVINYSSSTDAGTGAKGSRFTSTYKISVSNTQVAGSYIGQVKYVLVHPASNVPNQERTCPASKVCYWPNAGDMTVGGVGVVDTMGDQGLTAETTLWASNFKRAGYGFVGWSDKYDWELNANDASGNGTGNNAGYHIYGPNQTLTLNTSDYSGTNGGLSLYAVWAPSAGALQGWTGCSSLGSGKVTALTDIRDNDTYAVAKLADGKCWMIENLRLDYDANITTANTQSNNGAFGGVFSGLAEPETANFTNSTTANSLYKSDGSGDIKGVNGATLSDIGTTNSPDYRFPRYRNDNTNTDSTINANVNVANMTGTGQNVYSYGNYYIWAAAIADTSFYGTNNQSITTTSLCPTGWRLPKGGNKTRIESNDDNEFWNLIVDGLNNGTNPANYSSSNNPYYTGSEEGTPVSKLVRSYPNNFLYSGNAYTSSVNSRGSDGSYWSSTAGSSGNSYRLRLNSSNVTPCTDYVAKYYGYSIRCLVGS